MFRPCNVHNQGRVEFPPSKLQFESTRQSPKNLTLVLCLKIMVHVDPISTPIAKNKHWELGQHIEPTSEVVQILDDSAVSRLHKLSPTSSPSRIGRSKATTSIRAYVKQTQTGYSKWMVWIQMFLPWMASRYKLKSYVTSELDIPILVNRGMFSLRGTTFTFCGTWDYSFPFMDGNQKFNKS